MRLDLYLASRGMTESRAKAASAIAEGRVTVNGRPAVKPSTPVSETDEVVLLASETSYVSRAGTKLAHALDVFHVSPEGLTVADIGASTGGFTDCLLRRGAKYVYAVDVGTGQLHPSVLSDERVRNMEKTNARFLTKDSFDRPVDMAVADVSFISQSLLYPAIASFLPENAFFISLVKPQFEAGRESLGKNGIVRDPDGKIIRKIMERLISDAEKAGLLFIDMTDSPIAGGDGNKEYLACFRKKSGTPQN